jgi:aminoglycoside phosphotransferase (APT) family kinase protein
LPHDAVRLWSTIPQDELIVRLPGAHGAALVSTLESAVGVSGPEHLDALICSLLSGGPEWSEPQRASRFVWSVCMRMASSKEAAAEKGAKGFTVYTLEGPVGRGASSKTLSVDAVLSRAHEDVLRLHRNTKTQAGTPKMDAELRAYAAIARTLARTPLPAWYERYASGKLGQEPPAPLPSKTATSSFDYAGPLTLDAMCIAHAKFASDANGDVAELSYIAEGTDNVVLRIAKSDTVLRVRSVPQNEREQLEASKEQRIWNALQGQAVVPEPIAKPVVLAGKVPHSAVVMQRFKGGLDEDKVARALRELPALEDTLLELYARLSTVARCVDTKPGNVVMRTVAGSGTALALIDTDGHRCGATERIANVPWDAYVGPVSLEDLEYALSIAATQDAPVADSPLLFSAICLLVFHVVDWRLSDAKKATRYPRTRSILSKHFSVVWAMMLAHDAPLEETQKAGFMVAAYGGFLHGTEREKARGVLFPLPNARFAPHDHARDYWLGVGRLIDDLPLSVAFTDAEASPVASKIRALVKHKYPDANENRLRAHIALAVPRFEAKKGMLAWVRSSYDDSEFHAFLVRNTCSVDRLTAQAFVEVLRDSAPPLAALYTPDAAPDCASAIAAILAPVRD